jgi:hypothetical protein
MPAFPQNFRMPARLPAAAGRQMPMKSVLGKPGKFFDTRSKKLYDISQAYEGEKYDTICVNAGAQAPGTAYTFFNNVGQKTRIDTNFRTQNRLDPNERLVLERLGIYLHTAVGQNLNTMNDIRRTLENSFMSFRVNQDILWEGPTTWLPSGYGVYGQTTETDQTFASVGVPGTAAAARLRRKQMLTTEHSLEGDINFMLRTGWLNVGAGAIAYVNPTIVGNVLLKLVLHGPISRPATR